MTSPPQHRCALVFLATALAACADGAPTLVVEPPPTAPLALAAVECSVTVASGTVACRRPSTDLHGNGLIVGGQGTYVQLTSSNASYDGATFSVDVDVQNLIPQAMATTDGATPAADGVRVSFHQLPTVTGGTGDIDVANEDGTDTFTGTNQPYFEYSGALLGGDGILATNETSSPKTWQFSIDNTVTSFSFSVFVNAAVQFPQGWIDVSPAVDTLTAGGSQLLTAVRRSPVGNVMAGGSLTWGSGDPGVATVDGSGNLTAVSAGTVTINVDDGTRSGTATIAVCPDLEVGEAFTAVMPLAAGLCFGGGASGNAEYTYMPVNVSSSAALSLTLTGSGIVSVTGPPTPVAGDRGGLLGRTPAAATDGAAHEGHLRRDRALGNSLLRNPASRVRPGGRALRTPGGPSRLIVPGVPSVGDLWDLNVASGCSGTLDIRTGRVVSVGQHVVVVADTMNPPGGFTTAQYDSIRLEFDSLAYPVDTANFGGPTDLDTNGRVVAFYTRAVNELSPPASSVVVTGFFTSRDLFSSAPESCPRSNEGEMFYMLVPDPTGAVNSNVRTVSFVRGGTVGTMGHELQHLINASRRIYLENAAQLEEVWMNEGLSHISEELLFYRTSVGLAPRGNIITSNLTTGPNASRRVAAFNTYANQNFGRLRSWLQRPDTAGPVKNNDVLATRGAVWAFLRYTADRLNGNDAQLWYDLVNTAEVGATNLNTVTGVNASTDWVRDFISAMYADDAVAGIGAAQQVTSWNFRSLYIALNTSYQLVPRPLTNGVGLTLSYSRGGGTAYARFGVPTGGFATVTALSGGVPPVSPYALIVVRTK